MPCTRCRDICTIYSTAPGPFSPRLCSQLLPQLQTDTGFFPAAPARGCVPEARFHLQSPRTATTAELQAYQQIRTPCLFCEEMGKKRAETRDEPVSALGRGLVCYWLAEGPGLCSGRLWEVHSVLLLLGAWDLTAAKHLAWPSCWWRTVQRERWMLA